MIYNQEHFEIANTDEVCSAQSNLRAALAAWQSQERARTVNVSPHFARDFEYFVQDQKPTIEFASHESGVAISEDIRRDGSPHFARDFTILLADSIATI